MLQRLLAGLLFCAALPASAASVTTTWLGGTGTWTDPAGWSAGVPQNTPADSFDAVIDGGNPEQSVVTLSSQATIDTLVIDSGDRLVVTPDGGLSLQGSVLVNSGEIVLQSGPNAYVPSLGVSPSGLELQGEGSVRLENFGVIGGDGPLTNQDNVISGSGLISALGFTNRGVVEAGAGERLIVGNTQGGVVNSGVLRAVDGGVLTTPTYLAIDNTGGTIEALNGSNVDFPDEVFVRGGTVSAFGHSTMLLSASFDGTEFFADSDSRVVLGIGLLTNVSFDGQFVFSAPVLSGIITNRGVIRGDLTVAGATTIVNQGQIVLHHYDSSNDPNSVLSFAGGGTVTLDAVDDNPNPVAVRNVDNEMRGAGSMRRLQLNGGLIEASGGVLSIGGSALDHTGVFAAAPDGTLEMAATVTGSGAWRADGGQIHVTGNIGTTGDIAVVHGGSLAVDTTMSGGNLLVDNSGSVVLTPTGQLTLNGNQIENAGEISLHGTGIGNGLGPQSLVLNAPDTVLSGAGSVHLDGGALSSSVELGRLALVNVDNRLEGWGTIYAREFDNYGVIEANVAGQVLDVTTNSGANYGTMRAVGGATLFLANYCCGFTNYGAIEALDGSHVDTTDTNQTGLGSSFTALRHSTMDLHGSYSGEFVTDSDSLISIGANDQTSVGDATFDGNIDLLGPMVSGTITNRGLIRGGVDVIGPTTIVNQGQIILQYEEPRFAGDLSFSGGGAVTLDATNGDQGAVAPIRNVDNEMRGTGRLRLLQNGGLIEASGGVLTVFASQTDHTGVFAAADGGTLEMAATVTGSGAWRADGGQIQVTGIVGTTGDITILHGGLLSVDTAMSGGNLLVDDTGSLDIQGALHVAGSVDFDGANAGRWNFAPTASLEANRGGGAAVGQWGGWQFFEASGRDLGLVAAGFTSDNFYLPELVVGAYGRLVLRDLRDNGNHSGDSHEAVYVDTLVFSDSLGLLNLNGIDLYYNHLVGSVDQIINVAVPEPSSPLLLGLAMLGLGVARLRYRGEFRN
jgi:hypothetical protein